MQALAENAPPELILPLIFKFVTPAAANKDTRQRWAALHAISAAAGGCGEYIRMTCLGDVMRLICTLLRDPMLAVRRTACITLSDLGFYCQPDIAEYSVSFFFGGGYTTTLPCLHLADSSTLGGPRHAQRVSPLPPKKKRKTASHVCHLC